MTHNNAGEEKIEDIIKSVKNLIDNHNNRAVQSEVEPAVSSANKQTGVENVLELTSIIQDKDLSECLISDKVRSHAQEEINKIITAFKQEYNDKYQSMTLIVNDLMRPLIKDWLNNNLSNMVEKIISEEIKKIIPK
ncbi:MAG: DUF2497 domain-containing protein [Rickettsiales bacterium]|nr:MAG: DUF2497 domain-containing protein [Rickettsiales bacterium]